MKNFNSEFNERIPSHTYFHIAIKKDTMALIIKCMEIYMKNHPESVKTKITQDKIVFEICNYYISMLGER